jgi:enoyl-CoA hydratase
MSDPVLLEDRQGGVLHLTLNRPAKRNALSAELRDRLTDALDVAVTDDSVGAVLLSGAGDHFCAGFDLDEIAHAADPAAVFTGARRYHHRVHTFDKPIIAAIVGSAVAGGLDLALMCDLRVASTDARLGQPQVRHGIPASYDLIAGIVGDPFARDLCLTGRIVEAEEAHRRGLVHRVVAPDQLIETARQLATDIASTPAVTMKQQFLERQADLFS